MVVPEPCFALAPKGEVRASPRGGGWPPAPSRSSRDQCAEPRYICQTEGSCHARVADVSAVQRDCTHQVNAPPSAMSLELRFCEKTLRRSVGVRGAGVKTSQMVPSGPRRSVSATRRPHASATRACAPHWRPVRRTRAVVSPPTAPPRLCAALPPS